MISAEIIICIFNAHAFCPTDDLGGIVLQWELHHCGLENWNRTYSECDVELQKINHFS